MDAQTMPPAAEIESEPKSEKRPRGFAAMGRETQRALAQRGGRAAHARGTAHEFSSKEAREAGRRGGEAVAKDREYMSKIGRAGARKSAEVRSRRAKEEAKANETPEATTTSPEPTTTSPEPTPAGAAESTPR